jgi:hypothetical protein
MRITETTASATKAAKALILPAPTNDRRRGQSSRQHSGEIDGAEEPDREVGKALDPGSQGGCDAHGAVAADRHQDGQQERGDGGKSGGHKGESAFVLADSLTTWAGARRFPGIEQGSIKCGAASKIGILALSAGLYIGPSPSRSGALPLAMAMNHAEPTMDPG